MERLDVKYLDKRSFVAEVRNHKVTIDLPLAAKGRDTGPTPPELFVMSLASCIGMYLVFYCEKAGLDAAGLDVDAEYTKSADRIEEITVKFSLPAAKTEEQRKEAMGWAEKCLIHNTIRYQPKVKMLQQ